jgi:hypothetical protein
VIMNLLVVYSSVDSDAGRRRSSGVLFAATGVREEQI